MTGAEKITEVGTQLAEIKQKIQAKYDKVMGKVGELQQKLIELDEAITNGITQSLQWIEKQKQKIKTKIDTLVDKIKTWLEDQLDKAKAWMENIKKDIMDFIEKLLLAPILAMAGI